MQIQIDFLSSVVDLLQDLIVEIPLLMQFLQIVNFVNITNSV